MFWFFAGVFVASLILAATLAIFVTLDAIDYRARHAVDDAPYDWTVDGF